MLGFHLGTPIWLTMSSINPELVRDWRSHRSLIVAALFGLTLIFLVAANLVKIPNPSGSSNPNSPVTNLAVVSLIGTFIVAIPERRTRLLLGVLLGSLWGVLMMLSLSGEDYRFLWQTGEGEFSMMMITLPTVAAILGSTAVLRPLPTGAEGDQAFLGAEGVRSQLPPSAEAVQAPLGAEGVQALFHRALWSTRRRRILLVLLGAYYVLVSVILITAAATAEDSQFEIGSLSTGLLTAAIAVLSGYLASRADDKNLKIALWALAGLLGFATVVSGGVGFLFFLEGMHAMVALGAFAASAAAVDARGDGVKTWFSLLTGVAVVAWVSLGSFGFLLLLFLVSLPPDF